MSRARSNIFVFGESYGLDAVATHNRATANSLIHYNSDGGCVDYSDFAVAAHQDLSLVENAQTPRSTATNDSIQTRSGRYRRRTDSPLNATRSGISKSLMPRFRMEKKSKLDKSRTPKLTAPLSVLTRDMSTPIKDMDAWVNRSLEIRRQEVEKRNGYVTRPMNSFMLYRSAYADRTKVWCAQNNHQVVSSVSGESWPMEPQEIRDQFNEWARVERDNHQAAHPDYKFSPSKLNSKHRKVEDLDDEADMASIDRDPDDSYRPTRRSVRHKRLTPARDQPSEVEATMSFDSQPYFGQQSTLPRHHSTGVQFQQTCSLTDIGYGPHDLPYNMHLEQYSQPNEQVLSSYHYGQEMEGGGGIMPQRVFDGPVGGYGLPGGQQKAVENFFTDPQDFLSMLPAEQYYHEQTHAYQQPYHQIPTEQLYEHQRWLPAQFGPQIAIDSGLEVEPTSFSDQRNQCKQDVAGFDSTMGNDLSDNVPDFFEECASPRGVLASPWNTMEELR